MSQIMCQILGVARNNSHSLNELSSINADLKASPSIGIMPLVTYRTAYGLILVAAKQ